MAWRTIRSFLADESGAIAALHGFALVGLLTVALFGYDYTRLVSVDTELQNAADQAAIAAATQLDQQSDSIDRAEAAVRNYFANAGSSVVNRTLLAERLGQETSALNSVAFTFYKTYDSSTDVGVTTSTDAEATAVKVTINVRRVDFALTPLVDAIAGADVTADAVAGLQPATCKLPPMMVCGPTGTDFPQQSDIGKGLLLKLAATTWAPGNFGFVDFGNGGNTVKELMGTNSASDTCVVGGSLTSQPGNIASATDYLNTRFDIYTNPLTPADCSNGDYCPARNTRKDLVIKEEYTFDKIKNQEFQPAAPPRPACGAPAPAGGSKTETDWTTVPPASLPTGQIVGYPRDNCHVSGSCAGGNIGDGTWDITRYRASHPNVPAGLTTRYQIYKWERDNPGSGLENKLVNTSDVASWKATGNGTKKDWTATWTNYCSYPNPLKGTYYPTEKDRRLLTVAVVDCTGASGAATLKVQAWMDVFLTEPSWNRSTPVTSVQDVYGEVADVARAPDGRTAFQMYSLNKVVLLK